MRALTRRYKATGPATRIVAAVVIRRIQAGRDDIARHQLERQPPERQRRQRRVLQHELHVEQWVATAIALRLQHLHQLFKRDVLMLDER